MTIGTSLTVIDKKCPYCAGSHLGPCLHVKSIEYYENGTVKRVEFVQPLVSMPLQAQRYGPPAPLQNSLLTAALSFFG